jgi:hypothetical protein
MGRDGYLRQPARLETDDELIAFIDRLNAEGLPCGRLSSSVLLTLMASTSQELSGYLQSLDPFGTGLGVKLGGRDTFAKLVRHCA